MTKAALVLASLNKRTLAILAFGSKAVCFVSANSNHCVAGSECTIFLKSARSTAGQISECARP